MRLATLIILACLTLPAAALDLRSWQSKHHADVAAVGRIVTGAGDDASAEALLDAIRSADFVLIGEIHNNPDHHRIQADLLAAMTEDGRMPAVVFEMIPAGMQDRIDAYLAGDGGPEGFGDAVEWNERGWPDWAMYRPIADVAFAAGLGIVAGDLDRGTIRAIGRSGRDALDDTDQRRLALDLPMTDDMTEAMRTLLSDAHCGYLPDAALGPMQTVQRARDGALAAAMLEAEADGAVLITGNGHARKDWGVPAILAARNPDAKIVVVGLLEAPVSGTGASPLYDFVIVTPRVEIKDHCAELAERFGGGKQEEN